MSKKWMRYKLTAAFLSDAHLGSGSGGGGIDALIARDRNNFPVIWASHVEGVLRDAVRRLRGDEEAEKFFGRSGGDQQRAVFTSLYAEEKPENHIWCSTAREAFDNRAPQDDTLRIIEYVPKGTKLVGEVELPESDLPTLQRLVQEVDALGSGRSTGAGRVKLSLSEIKPTTREMGDVTGRLVLLLKNRDPLCITATAMPDNLIPSLAFVPGRALLGSIASWLIAEGDRHTASLLTSGKISVSDALPLPREQEKLDGVAVLPAPLSLQSKKPKGAADEIPWWAQTIAPTKRLDSFSEEAESVRKDGTKLKRPEDDLFVYRGSEDEAWTAFKPARRVRLRNGRPDARQADPSLFAIEQIVEETHFLAELQGSLEVLKQITEKLAPALKGERWLRLGRAGAPVEVVRIAWLKAPAATKIADKVLLTLTSDLLVRDEHLRWRTALDENALHELIGTDDITLVKTEKGAIRELQDSTMVHGFNGTSRLWRMPAAAIRRGSVFEVSGVGVAKLAERAAKNEWLGERTHEGFGRFRIDTSLPDVTGEISNSNASTPDTDIAEEAIAAITKKWFDDHKALTKSGGGSDRKPSLSQWLDLVSDLERGDTNALISRLNPTTAGGKSWEHRDAKDVLDELNKITASQQKLYSRFFVRWLRAEIRKKMKEVQ